MDPRATPLERASNAATRVAWPVGLDSSRHNLLPTAAGRECYLRLQAGLSF
jgi:hypothetical protein